MTTKVLSGKRILVISPQAWDKVRVSKHHYAITLAEKGNTVFFLNPPSDEGPSMRQEETSYPGLSIIHYRPFFPVAIRFRLGWLFRRLMAVQVKRLMREIGGVDIVWCFEPNLYADLEIFGARVKIFHPVDVFTQDHAVKVAKSADVIFSVSPTILSYFSHLGKPGYFVNHGLGKDFVLRALERREVFPPMGEKRKMGYVGNLLIPYIDRDLLRNVIEGCADVEFHMIGPYASGQSSLGSGSNDAEAFIRFLLSCSNVVLTGPMGSAQLAERLAKMDGFLICYSNKHAGYDLSNSHKILEYLSAGKAIITTPVLAYLDKTELVTMPVGLPEEEYPRFFIDAISNLENLNTDLMQEKRRQFALENTYQNQVARIEQILQELKLIG